MAKLTSFATGVGSGYLAGERLKKTEARQKRQDDILEKYLTSGDASMKKDPMSSTTFDPETGGTMDMLTGKVTYYPDDLQALGNESVFAVWQTAAWSSRCPSTWTKCLGSAKHLRSDRSKNSRSA